MALTVSPQLPRSVLIAGASRGLGRHFARHLAGRGVRVAASARDTGALESLRAEIAADGGTCAPVELDVRRGDSVDRGVAEAADALGGLDGVVVNAGILQGADALSLSDEDWRAVMETNLDGAFRVCRAAGRAMRDAGGGAIVNVGSILGIGVSTAVAAYAVSKAGLHHLTRALALEWARYGVRVNAIAPGYVPTSMNREFLQSEAGERLRRRIPMRRFGSPEDLDGALELLLSERGQYITGVVLPVDGGHVLRGF